MQKRKRQTFGFSKFDTDYLSEGNYENSRGSKVEDKDIQKRLSYNSYNKLDDEDQEFEPVPDLFEPSIEERDKKEKKEDMPAGNIYQDRKENIDQVTANFIGQHFHPFNPYMFPYPPMPHLPPMPYPPDPYTYMNPYNPAPPMAYNIPPAQSDQHPSKVTEPVNLTERSLQQKLRQVIRKNSSLSLLLKIKEEENKKILLKLNEKEAENLELIESFLVFYKENYEFVRNCGSLDFLRRKVEKCLEEKEVVEVKEAKKVHKDEFVDDEKDAENLIKESLEITGSSRSSLVKRKRDEDLSEGELEDYEEAIEESIDETEESESYKSVPVSVAKVPPPPPFAKITPKITPKKIDLKKIKNNHIGKEYKDLNDYVNKQGAVDLSFMSDLVSLAENENSNKWL